MVNEFRQLQLIEQDLMYWLVKVSQSLPPERRGNTKQLEVIGSARQGSFSSSLFNPHCRENGERICKELDFDIQGALDEDLENPSCLEDIQGKLGHVAIRSHCIKHFNCIKHFDDPSYNWTGTEFIQSYHVKEWILKRVSRNEKKEMRNFKFFFEFYLRSQRQKFKAIDINFLSKISKATSQRYINVTIDKKLYLAINVDGVSVIETKFTPKILKDFSERTSYNIPQSVLGHLYIVAKSSHEEKFNKNTTECSYSFCHIENYIFTDVFTDTQTLIYLISKSIYKKHIQPLDNNLLTSYFLKTISLWRFENEEFSQDDWFNDTKILTQTRHLFKDLKRSLEKGVLPSYFIPKLNLIEGMNKELIKDVIDVVEHKVLGTPLEDLFNVKELREAQEFLQEKKSLILFALELDNYKNFFRIVINI